MSHMHTHSLTRTEGESTHGVAHMHTREMMRKSEKQKSSN